MSSISTSVYLNVLKKADNFYVGGPPPPSGILPDYKDGVVSFRELRNLNDFKKLFSLSPEENQALTIMMNYFSGFASAEESNRPKGAPPVSPTPTTISTKDIMTVAGFDLNNTNISSKDLSRFNLIM